MHPSLNTGCIAAENLGMRQFSDKLPSFQGCQVLFFLFCKARHLSSGVHARKSPHFWPVGQESFVSNLAPSLKLSCGKSHVRMAQTACIRRVFVVQHLDS